MKAPSIFYRLRKAQSKPISKEKVIQYLNSETDALDEIIRVGLISVCILIVLAVVVYFAKFIDIVTQ